MDELGKQSINPFFSFLFSLSSLPVANIHAGMRFKSAEKEA